MITGIYYLNNSGSRWICLVNGKRNLVTLQTKSGKTVTRTAVFYESFGNFASVTINYKGKRISVLADSLLDD